MQRKIYAGRGFVLLLCIYNEGGSPPFIDIIQHVPCAYPKKLSASWKVVT